MKIACRDEGPVRIATMSCPGGLNVFTEEALSTLEGVLLAADEDDSVRALILAGTERSFSVGVDIDAFPSPPADPTDFVSRFLRGNSLPERLRKPVIASANGVAIAGGLELALACDWIFASPTTRFSLPEAHFGLVAGFAASRLPQMVGTHWARRLLMTGESLSADEAAAIGLPVTVADDSLRAAMSMAEQICRSAPQAVRIIKERSVADAQSHDPGFATGLGAYARLWNLPDTRGAVKAWRDRREPAFRPLSDPWGAAE